MEQKRDLKYRSRVLALTFAVVSLLLILIAYGSFRNHHFEFDVESRELRKDLLVTISGALLGGAAVTLLFEGHSRELLVDLLENRIIPVLAESLNPIRAIVGQSAQVRYRWICALSPAPNPYHNCYVRLELWISRRCSALPSDMFGMIAVSLDDAALARFENDVGRLLLWEAQPGSLSPSVENSDLFDIWNVSINGTPLSPNKLKRSIVEVPGGRAARFSFAVPKDHVGRPGNLSYSALITKFVGDPQGLIDVNTKFYCETRDIEMTLFCDSRLAVALIQPNIEVDQSLLDAGEEVAEYRLPALFRSLNGVRTARVALPGARKGSSVHFVVHRSHLSGERPTEC
jgi:hypothetical protein